MSDLPLRICNITPLVSDLPLRICNKTPLVSDLPLRICNKTPLVSDLSLRICNKTPLVTLPLLTLPCIFPCHQHCLSMLHNQLLNNRYRHGTVIGFASKPGTENYNEWVIMVFMLKDKRNYEGSSNFLFIKLVSHYCCMQKGQRAPNLEYQINNKKRI